MRNGWNQTPKVVEAITVWIAWPHEIEFDLENYTKYSIKDWLRGKMSSRKFMMLLEGIINSHQESWLRFVVQRDAAQARQEYEDRLEAEVKAVNKAQMHNQPLRMSDLGEDYVPHDD